MQSDAYCFIMSTLIWAPHNCTKDMTTPSEKQSATRSYLKEYKNIMPSVTKGPFFILTPSKTWPSLYALCWLSCDYASSPVQGEAEAWRQREKVSKESLKNESVGHMCLLSSFGTLVSVMWLVQTCLYSTWEQRKLPPVPSVRCCTSPTPHLLAL